MKPKEIRHNRIVEIRNRALRGETVIQLRDRIKEWGVSNLTIDSYMDEVAESLRKVMNKNV